MRRTSTFTKKIHLAVALLGSSPRSSSILPPWRYFISILSVETYLASRSLKVTTPTLGQSHRPGYEIVDPRIFAAKFKFQGKKLLNYACPHTCFYVLESLLEECVEIRWCSGSYQWTPSTCDYHPICGSKFEHMNCYDAVRLSRFGIDRIRTVEWWETLLNLPFDAMRPRVGSLQQFNSWWLNATQSLGTSAS